MKSSYELAMERLQKLSPTVKLSRAQKAELAELDSQYAARIAQREIGLKDDIFQADNVGDTEKAAKLREQFLSEKMKLLAELEERKDRIRQSK